MQNIIEKNLIFQKCDKLNKNNWKISITLFLFFIMYNQFISKNIGKNDEKSLEVKSIGKYNILITHSHFVFYRTFINRCFPMYHALNLQLNFQTNFEFHRTF